MVFIVSATGDEKAITQPWLQADGDLASLMLGGLVSCVNFILDAIPASRNALSQIWQLYASSYARPTVAAHILSSTHIYLSRLPWQRFWPSVQDVETMLRVAAQQLPDCHMFLCHVFHEVDWPAWLVKLGSSADVNVVSRVHACLLQLLVRLAAERRNATAEETARSCRLLGEAAKWAWQLLVPADVAHALDWFVMGVDPRVVFVSAEDGLEVDHAILK